LECGGNDAALDRSRQGAGGVNLETGARSPRLGAQGPWGPMGGPAEL